MPALMWIMDSGPHGPQRVARMERSNIRDRRSRIPLNAGYGVPESITTPYRPLAAAMLT
jgi:hypothetical protein